MSRAIQDKIPYLKGISSKKLARFLKQENRAYPKHLVQIPEEKIPPKPKGFKSAPVEMWRSSGFLLQVFEEPNGIERLSIQRTRIMDNGEWRDGITWDELQQLKAECGRGDKQAIEIYPADEDVVNVANLRHLWVLTEPMEFTWSNN